MAQLCPHCKGSTQFKVTLTGEGIVELKNDAFELISQGEIGIQDGTLVCVVCGQPVANDTLVPALECAECHTVTPVENMVQLQNEDGTNGAVICTGCYEKMTAPSPAEMSKEQLLELNNNKDAQMADMQAQMQQMMATMQQMQAQMNGGGTAQAAATKQATNKGGAKKTTTPAQPTEQVAPPAPQTPPVQEPTVDTNLPMPNAVNEEVNVIDPGAVPNEESITPSFFGGEAPF